MVYGWVQSHRLWRMRRIDKQQLLYGALGVFDLVGRQHVSMIAIPAASVVMALTVAAGFAQLFSP